MLEIRYATEDDDAALAALDRETWSPKVSPGPRRAPAEPFFSERLRPRDVLVATVDGAPAGSIVSGPPFQLASNSHQLGIKGLAVDPARRREGIGAALIEALVERARGAGIRRLTLRVLSTNPAARALYERAGLRGRRRAARGLLLDGVYVDDVLMGLDLT